MLKREPRYPHLVAFRDESEIGERVRRLASQLGQTPGAAWRLIARAGLAALEGPPLAPSVRP